MSRRRSFRGNLGAQQQYDEITTQTKLELRFNWMFVFYRSVASRIVFVEAISTNIDRPHAIRIANQASIRLSRITSVITEPRTDDLKIEKDTQAGLRVHRIVIRRCEFRSRWGRFEIHVPTSKPVELSLVNIVSLGYTNVFESIRAGTLPVNYGFCDTTAFLGAA